MPSKISMVIEAGRNLESHKTGFTVSDLMNNLKWEESERFYLQNTMAQLTRKGVSKKMGPEKPIVYSFKKASGNGSGNTATNRQAREKAAPRDKKSRPQLTVENAAQMDISPELAGQGVLYLNAQLKEKKELLESEIAAVKQQLTDAMTKIDAQNKTIQEQAATIETQEQTIANLKRDYKLLTRVKTSPIIQKKKTVNPGGAGQGR